MAHEQEIAALEALLNSGLKSSTVDGITTTFDLKVVQDQITKLKLEDDNAPWPRFSTIKLSSGFDE